MRDELAQLLTRLPEPEAPSSITTTVMARLAREADETPTAHGATLEPVRRDRLGWIVAVAGAVVIAGAIANGWVQTWTAEGMLSPRLIREGFSGVRIEGWAAPWALLGLLCYLGGLFAPLRSRAGRRAR